VNRTLRANLKKLLQFPIGQLQRLMVLKFRKDMVAALVPQQEMNRL